MCLQRWPEELSPMSVKATLTCIADGPPLNSSHLGDRSEITKAVSADHAIGPLSHPLLHVIASLSDQLRQWSAAGTATPEQVNALIQLLDPAFPPTSTFKQRLEDGHNILLPLPSAIITIDKQLKFLATKSKKYFQC